jgi:hypothetical protein
MGYNSDSRMWTGLIWLRIYSSASREHRNEASGSLKYEKLLNYLRNYQAFKEDFAPRVPMIYELVSALAGLKPTPAGLFPASAA